MQQRHKDKLFYKANNVIEDGILSLFPAGIINIGPKRLSALFRNGGDLIDYIHSRFSKTDNHDRKNRKIEADNPLFFKNHNVSDDAYERPETIAVDDTHLWVKTEGKYEKIGYSDIIYIQGSKDYVNINLAGGKIISKIITMKTLESKLPVSQFIRCHRSYIVNLNRISELEDSNTIRINDGEVPNLIPIGKQYKTNVMDFINPKLL
jgi:DNA-binding LytR/AlgR family response regulator